MTEVTSAAPTHPDTGRPAFNLAVIGGDGIGPEVVAEGLKVLDAAAGPGAFSLTHYDLGAERWKRTGEVLPDSVLAELDGADAILFGAVGAAPGDTQVPSGLLERGLLLRLRFAFDHYVNLRPSRLFPGVSTPLDPSVVAGREVDFVVVREGTEGLYCGNGGVVRTGTPAEIATEVSINTAYGVERVVRDAFERATRRRNKLTLVHKHNVLVHAGGLWNRQFNAVAAEYPGVSHRLSACRRGHDLPGHRPGPLRRDRHRQPVRRHPHRPGRSGYRWDRAGGQRQHQPRTGPPLHVRAGARLGARYRRPGKSRPDRGHPVGQSAA